MLHVGQARALARVAQQAILTHFPHHAVHLVRDRHDAQLPSVLHPAFHGSYDWHSCVHMHWSLARLWSRFPADHEVTTLAQRVLGTGLTSSNIQQELAYFQAPGRAGFERPYGWAWLLKLDSELAVCAQVAPDSDAHVFRDALRPLCQHIAVEFVGFLNTLHVPVRHGVHGNTAFACVLALQWARLNAHWELVTAIETQAQNWFIDDLAHGVHWEPSGTDFLSPTLTEALLMSQIVPTAQFIAWFDAFLPIPLAETPLHRVARPGDRADAQMVHLDGLNLSRAWCARGLLQVLPLDHREAGALSALAAEGIAASAAEASDGEFVATHWLTSFLLLAETEYSGVL